MQARILAPIAALALAVAIGCMPASPPAMDIGNGGQSPAKPGDRLGLEAGEPRPLDIGQAIRPAAGGVMVVTVKWPPLSVQKIPTGTKAIILYVYQNNQLKAEPQKLTRPGGAPFIGALVTASAFAVNTTGKVFVEAFAYPTDNPVNDSPTAWGSAQAVIADGQETPVRIVLQSGGDTTQPTPTPSGSGSTGSSPVPSPSGTRNLMCEINPALCGESPTPGPTATPATTPTPAGSGSPGPTATPGPTPSGATPTPTAAPTENPDRVMSVDVTSNSGTFLRVPPDSPTTAQMTATVNFSLSSPAQNPNGIAWSSSLLARAGVNATGLVTVPSGATAGQVTIQAVYQGATGSIVLDVVRRGSLQLIIE